ncbi:hypothetical protein [Amycolatopsis thermophila]|uniref:Uncharacterized protein n=1 Tax=Amycolatopsis thermophila TaxID=206084 RepID=A0ABU0F0U6_9PSEU|nr:hypothetical protein [Amycolatopsis thermophila]MDQ0380692.1 hypothetical protein [Amycolatopsis thermophila]
MMKTITDDTVEIPWRKPVFVDPSGRRRRILRRVSIAACALVSGYAVLLVASLLGAPIPASALLPVPDQRTTDAPVRPAPPAPGGGPSTDDTPTPDTTGPSSEEPVATAAQPPAPATTGAPPPVSSSEPSRTPRGRSDPPGHTRTERPEPRR